MLFLSQPLGVGFSYGSEGVGSLNPGKSTREVGVMEELHGLGDTRDEAKSWLGEGGLTHVFSQR